MPWVKLVIADMYELQSYHCDKLLELGDPIQSAHRWHAFIKDYPWQWKELVRQYKRYTSVCDRRTSASNTPAPTLADDTMDVPKFQCVTCLAVGVHEVFASNMGLSAHCRTKHKQRTQMRL